MTQFSAPNAIRIHPSVREGDAISGYPCPTCRGKMRYRRDADGGKFLVCGCCQEAVPATLRASKPHYMPADSTPRVKGKKT